MGSIWPKGTVAVEEYEDQTFRITAEEGFSLVDVLVDGVSVGAVEEYTINSVMEDHTIHAVFESASLPATGGDSAMVMFVAAGMILAAGVIACVICRTSKNNEIKASRAAVSYGRPSFSRIKSPTSARAILRSRRGPSSDLIFILYALHSTIHSGNFLATYNINSIYQH